MSFKVCFGCGTYVKYSTTPPRYHPCTNKNHKSEIYTYNFEKDVPDDVEQVEFVDEKPEERCRTGDLPDVVANPQPVDDEDEVHG